MTFVMPPVPDLGDRLPLPEAWRAWLDAEADRRARAALTIAYRAGAEDMQRATLDHLSTIVTDIPDEAERRERMTRLAADNLARRRAAMDAAAEIYHARLGRPEGYVYRGGPILTDWVDGKPWAHRYAYRCMWCPKRVAFTVRGDDVERWRHVDPLDETPTHTAYPATDAEPIDL